MTANASWAARDGHTSVADAAGRIYVLGGLCYDAGTFYNDVWRSADQGAAPHRSANVCVRVVYPAGRYVCDLRVRLCGCVRMRACVRACVRAGCACARTCVSV
jgi:hypothetical protein